jgi:hypothetical protein
MRHFKRLRKSRKADAALNFIIPGLFIFIVFVLFYILIMGVSKGFLVRDALGKSTVAVDGTISLDPLPSLLSTRFTTDMPLAGSTTNEKVPYSLSLYEIYYYGLEKTYETAISEQLARLNRVYDSLHKPVQYFLAVKPYLPCTPYSTCESSERILSATWRLEGFSGVSMIQINGRCLAVCIGHTLSADAYSYTGAN